MRTAILNHIKANAKQLGTFKVSDQLPWIDNNVPLYLDNKKHIYVDTDNTHQLPMFDALDQAGTVEETTTVNVYFANDAKKLPAEYDSVVQAIKSARIIPESKGYFQRTVNVVNSYNVDVLITHFEFTFKQLLTN